MRSTNDPIAGLKQKLLDWGVTSEEELKSIDKQARSEVDEEVAIAESKWDGQGLYSFPKLSITLMRWKAE